MDAQAEIEFLTLLDDKVGLVIAQVAVREPLIEVSAMIQGRIARLRSEVNTTRKM